MSSILELVYTIAIWVVPVLLAITLHEAAHGWVAYKLGDPTAKSLGRISINPLRHIDPMGTIMIPLLMLITVGVAFGSAKPVPVNPRYFKQPHLDMALVALAGPASNFVMAAFWALLITISVHFLPPARYSIILQHIGQAGVAINLILIALNILPIPPLDGSKIMAGILPTAWANKFVRFERYGFFLLIGLIALEVGMKIPVFSSLLLMLVKPFMLFFETVFNFQGIYF
jgi:Zn-dependent protease